MRETGIVVVGAGPAGAAAAVQCARLGVAPVILERAGRAGGLIGAAHLIENYPGVERPLTGAEFAGRLQAHLDRFGLAVTAESAARVEARDGRWLVTSDAGAHLAAAVILAVGTAPRAWSVPGAEELRGRAVFDDVRELQDRGQGSGMVLVIGGGEAAFDYALGLARDGAEVTILVRGPAARVGGRLPALAAEQPRIRVETGTVVSALEDHPRGVAALLETPRGTERRVAHAVLTAVGRVAALGELLPATPPCSPPPRRSGNPQEVPIERAPGLFVCGDARLCALGQAGMAVGDGLAAAAPAVDRARKVRG